MNLSYELIKHVKRNIAVSVIWTVDDINDTIPVIVDYRVGIGHFNVYKCDVTDTLLPHGAAEVRFELVTLAFPC